MSLDVLLRCVKQIRSNEFNIEGIIGRGNFGSVLKGNLTKDNNIVAIKTSDTERGKKALVFEAFHLSKLKQENIVQFYGVCLAPLSIILEYIDGFSVYDIVRNKQAFYFDISLGISWALQCAKAVAYLHQLDAPIIHRDLNTSNMLVNQSGKVLKIVDFGIATVVRDVMTNNQGTPLFIAPEVLRTNKYSTWCDVYSFSIVMWEIYYKKSPFEGRSIDSWQRAVCRNERLPVSGLGVLDDLIQECWEHDPAKRITMVKTVEYLQIIKEDYPVGNNVLQHLYRQLGGNAFVPTGYSIGATTESSYSLETHQPETELSSHIRAVYPAKPTDLTIRIFNEHSQLELEYLKLRRRTEKLQEKRY